MKKFRRKYKRPRVAWNTQQIAETRALLTRYGLRRRRELLQAVARVRNWRARARRLIAHKDPAGEKLLLTTLQKLGVLPAAAGLDDVLALKVENMLDRRLQTIVHKKGLASSVKHARQIIVHGHISINGRRTMYPSYVVSVDEEASIGWYTRELVLPAKHATVGQVATPESAEAEDAIEAAADAAEAV